MKPEDTGRLLADRVIAYAGQMAGIAAQGMVEGMTQGLDPRPWCGTRQPGTAESEGHICTRPIGHDGRHWWTGISWDNPARRLSQ